MSDVNFHIRGLNMACQKWHEPSLAPVLALHGWLDNSASFKPLSEKLKQYHWLVPDLFGQGLSDHRPESASYHLWDDLVDIKLLLEQADLPQCTIIGHSRGAMLAVLFAAIFPEKVTNIILIDAILPVPVKAEDAAEQMKQFTTQFSKASPKRRYFESEQQAIEIWAKAARMPEKSAAILLQRELAFEQDHGYFYRHDKRLQYASAIKLTAEHNHAMLNKIQCPVTIIMAKQGLANYGPVKQLQQAFGQFNWYEVDGEHHCHMHGVVDEVAKLCAVAMR